MTPFNLGLGVGSAIGCIVVYEWIRHLSGKDNGMLLNSALFGLAWSLTSLVMFVIVVGWHYWGTVNWLVQVGYWTYRLVRSWWDKHRDKIMAKLVGYKDRALALRLRAAHPASGAA